MSTSCLLPENIEKITKRDGGPHSLTEFDPKSTALIVIDMQNFYMAKNQLSYCEYAEAIVPNVNRLAMAMRQFGGKVIWVRNVTNPEGFKGWTAHYDRMTDERIAIRKKELAQDGEGFQLWEGLDVRKDDPKVNKIRYSAFIPGASNIEKVLGEHGIHTLVFCGVATNVCVESSARDAMMMNYHTLVVEDACAAGTIAGHEAALNALYLNFGDVQMTDQVLEALSENAEKNNAAAAE
ncbi:MAG: hydrolase [Rhodospirillaceae bacterium]|nr:hydrolase [Rhodospirillaceae bacterium]|tara:strand:- start:6294 stop:7004 length:711 start_codon:yes stop_codon:yes gene_type:complete